MKVLGACLNPRVLLALALTGVLVVVFAPGLAAVLIPLLIVAACPLSMLAMMIAMRHRGAGHRQTETVPGPAELRQEISQLAARQRLLERELAALPAAADQRTAEPFPRSTPAER